MKERKVKGKKGEWRKWKKNFSNNKAQIYKEKVFPCLKIKFVTMRMDFVRFSLLIFLERMNFIIPSD